MERTYCDACNRDITKKHKNLVHITTYSSNFFNTDFGYKFIFCDECAEVIIKRKEHIDAIWEERTKQALDGGDDV